MPSVTESLDQGSALKAGLVAGEVQLSQDQSVVFTLYRRVVLPLDGYVFWVNASLLSQSALYNGLLYNATALGQPQGIATLAPTVTVQGSLHYSSETRQDEDSTYAVNRVVFTTPDLIQELNQIGPDAMYVCTYQPPSDTLQGGVTMSGDPIKFAFSGRGLLFEQAGLYHYIGNALYSTMATQLVDDPRQLDTQNVVVSNSLPAWLGLRYFDPVWLYCDNPGIPLYPSFLSPDNLPPVYGTVHIGDEDTRPLQNVPYIDPFTGSHWQLASDKVRVTLYGTRNFNAQDFVDLVLQYAQNGGAFGIMSQPIIRDAKKTQPELQVIAMKKTILFEISYLQSRIRDQALQVISSCIPSFGILPISSVIPTFAAVA